MADNGAEVKSTATGLQKIPELAGKLKGLEGQLAAAQKHRVEEIALWAASLASEVPFLARLREAIEGVVEARPRAAVDIDVIARGAGVDLGEKRAAGFLEGPSGLRAQLADLERQRATAGEVLVERSLGRSSSRARNA